MDVKSLDDALVAIVEKKNQLKVLDYNSSQYDELETELHDLEDDLVSNFGDFLEDALYLVHDEVCPDNDVLLPIAYLANSYITKSEGGQVMYDVPKNEGVIVEADDFPGEETRLVIIPKPTRILLQVGDSYREEVWKAN